MRIHWQLILIGAAVALTACWIDAVTFTQGDVGLCGNNILDPGEICDDGNNQNGDGCDPGCLIEACGNSVTELGEECDTGLSDSPSCNGSICTFARCGDGYANQNFTPAGGEGSPEQC